MLSTQAWYLYSFVSLTKSIREWRTYAAWSAYKGRMLAAAARHRRRWLLRAALAGWIAGMLAGREEAAQLRAVLRWCRWAGA